MFKVGDQVIYNLDGVRGIVLEIDLSRCHILWEDCFCSWEESELLTPNPEHMIQKEAN